MDTMLLAVTDPDFGSISALVDAEGTILSTGGASPRFAPTNLQPYVEAADLAARELAALYAREHPEHAGWLEQHMWDACIAEGGA